MPCALGEKAQEFSARLQDLPVTLANGDKFTDTIFSMNVSFLKKGNLHTAAAVLWVIFSHIEINTNPNISPPMPLRQYQTLHT